MAKTGEYDNDGTITSGDKVLGTDGADGSTKNYSIGDLTTYFANQITILQGEMPIGTYDPAGIEEQLVGLTATQTLTNKTINGSNNTITNVNSSNVVLDSFVGQLINQTDIEAYIQALESDYLSDFMFKSNYDAANINEQLVGLTATQTLTNKTLDFTSGGTNTISADAADISLATFISNVVSSNNVQGGIEELDSALSARMLKSNYDPANIREQLVGLTATQTLINKTIAYANNTIVIDADDLDYSNTTSGLTATKVQAAIDEVDGNVDDIVNNSGWASYVDTNYTSGSPQVISANTDTVLLNGANTIVDSQKPEDINYFYYAQILEVVGASGAFKADEKITGQTSEATGDFVLSSDGFISLQNRDTTDFQVGEVIEGADSGSTAEIADISEGRIDGVNGNGLGITLHFKAVPSSSNQWMDVWIDVAGSVGELYRRTFYFPKGSGVEMGVSFDVSAAYNLSTWQSNGGLVYVRSSHPLNIYDINYNFVRTHIAR